MTLPDKGHVYVLETVEGKKQLVQLKYVDANLNRHSGSNFAKGSLMPFAKLKMTFELPGPTASRRFTDPLLQILVKDNLLETEDAENPGVPSPNQAEFSIVRLELENNHRIVNTFNVTSMSGHTSRTENAVGVKRERLPGTDWVRLIPTEKLWPGEYGIVRLYSDRSLGDSLVFDFAIEPAAKRFPQPQIPPPGMAPKQP